MTRDGRRIVIVGRSGQVSQSLAHTLHSAGHDIIQLGRPEADLLDPAAVADAILAARPDIVVNAAAYTGVDAAEDEPDVAEAINAAGAGTVAEAATRAGAPIIHFSTDYVFDGTNTSPYIETDATCPLGVYGKTKLEGERRVAPANPRHVILRTAWISSPFGNNFVKTMLRLAGERSDIRVVDDQHGNPTFAFDLADAVRQLVPKILENAAGASRFGIFHAVSQGQATWFGFAQEIMRGAAARGAAHAVIQPIETGQYPTKARRPAYSVLSTEKLEAAYGIRLPHWETSLSACLDQLIGPAFKELNGPQRRNVE